MLSNFDKVIYLPIFQMAFPRPENVCEVKTEITGQNVSRSIDI